MGDTTGVYDRTAVSYAAVWDGFVSPHLARFAAAVGPSATIGDLGCGTGRDSAALAAAGLTPVGVDLSAGMLAQAAAVVGCRRLVRADLRELPFGSASFAGLWVAAALLHVPHAQLAATLLELRRVAADGSPMFASVKVGAGEEVARDGRFFAYHTAGPLTSALVAAGFAVDEVITEPDSRRPDVTWLAVHATAR